MLVSEKNCLGTAVSAVRPRIKAHVAWLEQELDDLDEGLRQTLRSSPVRREKDDLLRTFPAWGSSSPSPSWLTCRSWARWIVGRSPPWCMDRTHGGRVFGDMVDTFEYVRHRA